MTVHLRLRQQPPIPIDMGWLSLAMLRELSQHAIEQLPLAIGRERSAVGEWFKVATQTSNSDRLVFTGDCGMLCGIGSDLAEGEVIVEGPAGAQLGRRMAGGTIRVQGNAGALAATAMRGGRIEIDGDAGDYLGGPRRGERTGMRGGRVVVRGDAGQGTGHRMRRGTILIHGSTGPCCGLEMVAGTIATARIDSTDVGFGMRRGTILIYVTTAASPFPTVTPCFASPTAAPAVFMKLLLDELRPDLPNEHATRQDRHPDSWQRSIGDLAAGGLGEIIWSGKCR